MHPEFGCHLKRLVRACQENSEVSWMGLVFVFTRTLESELVGAWFFFSRGISKVSWFGFAWDYFPNACQRNLQTGPKGSSP